MRTLLVIFFFITTVSLWAQYPSPNMNEEASRPVRMAEYDDNLFLCNWYTDQTFAYSQAKPDTTGGLAIKLCKDNEQFCIPKHGVLWSVFKKSHKGLDIDLKTGDTVRVMFDGVVRYAQYNKGGFGNLVIVRHYNGLETYYAHLSKFKVQSGDKVTAGTVLGLGGSTGRSVSPHLHLEVRYKDNALDPFSFIDWDTKTLKCNVLVLDKKVFSPWETNTVHSSATTVTANGTGDHPDHLETGEPAEAVPVTETVNNKTTDQSKGTWYTIRKGDTLYSIARKYGTSVKNITEMNGIANPDKISSGQKIRVK